LRYDAAALARTEALVRFTIEYQGVPVGMIDVEPQPRLVAGAVVPLSGYAAVQTLVSSASEVLRRLGFFGHAGAAEFLADRGIAIQQAAELGRALELRDAYERFIPTDFIELVETPYPEVPLAAFIRFRAAAAAIPVATQHPC
jgi:hypothetical protein